MESKKITQLATKVTPANTDLITIGDPTTGELKKATLLQIAGIFGGAGSVSSVSMTVPTGLSITGSPVTTSGTLAVTLTAGYSIPTTASQTTWDTAYTDRNKWDGGSTGLTAATGRISLGATTIGTNLFTLTNPSAISFLRVNADNSISALDAATFRTAIGAGTSSAVGTVTSVAALTIGTTGTDISSSVATGTTTPVITLNIPTASSTVRGALSKADWTTFNGKQDVLVAASATVDGYLTKANWSTFNGKQDVLVKADSTHNGYLDKADFISFDGKQNALGTGTAGQFLSYNQTWQSVPYPTLLSQLNDVAFTSITNGQLMRYTVGGWINFTPTYISASFLSATSPIFYNSTTGVISSQAATATLQGYVTTGAQTIAGNKTFNNDIIYDSGDAVNWYLRGPANGPTIRLKYNVGGTNRSGALGWMDNATNFTDVLYWIDSAITANVAISGTSVTLSSDIYAANAIIGFTTNSGYKLDVNGTARIAGTTNIVSTANASSLSITQYSITGTNSQSLINLTGVWNTTGSPTAIKLNITNTASGIDSNLMDLQIGAVSKFTINKTGAVTGASFYESSDKRQKTLIEDNFLAKGIETITPKLYTKNDKVELGYYAQDVQGILDGAVSEDEKGMLSLSYREVHTAKIYGLELEVKELKKLIKSMIDGNRN